MSRLLAVAILWLISGGFSGAAVDPLLPEDGAATGWASGTRTAGAGIGAGFGTRRFGGQLRHDLGFLQLSSGRFLSGALAGEQWYAGHIVAVGEVALGYRFSPEGAVLAGATPILRYSFAAGRILRPFVEAGAGVAFTDIGEPDLGGTIQFSPQAGAGAHWMLGRRRAVTFRYRLIHYSNGGFRSPNGGMNLHTFRVGLTRFY